MGTTGGVSGERPSEGPKGARPPDETTQKINQIIKIIQTDPEAQRYLSYDPSKRSQIEIDAKGHVSISDKKGKWHNLTLKGHQKEVQDSAHQILRSQSAALRVEVAPIPQHVLVSKELINTVNNYYPSVQYLVGKLKNPAKQEAFVNDLVAKGFSRVDAMNYVHSLFDSELVLRRLGEKLDSYQQALDAGDNRGAMQIWREVVGLNIVGAISTLYQVQETYKSFATKNKNAEATDKAIAKTLYDAAAPSFVKKEGFSRFFQRISQLFSTLQNTANEVNKQYQKSAPPGDADALALDAATQQVGKELQRVNEETRRNELIFSPEEHRDLWALKDLYREVESQSSLQAGQLDEIVLKQSKLVAQLADINKAYAGSTHPKLQSQLRSELQSFHAKSGEELNRLATDFQRVGTRISMEEALSPRRAQMQSISGALEETYGDVQSGREIIREKKLRAAQARANIEAFKNRANGLARFLGLPPINWDRSKYAKQMGDLGQLYRATEGQNPARAQIIRELMDTLDTMAIYEHNETTNLEMGKRAENMELIFDRADLERAKAAAYMSGERLYEI